ncbi:unnamed protein product [Microthlaspi erraticum]|uniref:Reverse transcriptase zinc-binding domain-containing protein n=1 Tax=Microthlaspi erraticum TaxID=1685480 RepID=A0A6D2JMB4_9BRAS|nr:unnamed protein product [Microthlaspi erraticum]
MSKAYDRVEWQFVEATMRKMGFGERWIGWIMKCIKSVVYKVLINGQPRGKITPNRGYVREILYLPTFILCTEVLISNLKRAESVKSLTGLKVARASPPVSHLLFADDSLFFCKATVEESAVLLQILQNYERASGQKINFDKSSIQFGHTVETTVRAEIHQMLAEADKRLDIKVLSKGGKEVMSIVSARPLVCKGLIKRVGSGSSISVWYDPWISDSCPRPAICKGINYYPHLTVNQLINSQTSTWNRPLLQQFFESEEITRITGIPVATGYKPDTWGWFYTTTGRYTVKSGYTVLQELSQMRGHYQFGPDTRRLQAQSWKVKCTTKLQHFLWQIITGCLSVGARLCSRGMRVDPLCVRCGMGDET